jgi:hypothetical protein
MNRMVSFLLAAMLLTGCGERKPQAAEGPGAAQAVAYIVFGLEDGVSLAQGDASATPVVRQKSADPLVYRIANSDKDQTGLEVSVIRLDDCNYTLAIEDKISNQPKLGFSLDFSGLKSVTLVESNLGMGSPRFLTNLEGIKMTCDNNQSSYAFCGRFKPQQMMRFASWDQSRLTQSVATFQANVCKGKGS